MNVYFHSEDYAASHVMCLGDLCLCLFISLLLTWKDHAYMTEYLVPGVSQHCQRHLRESGKQVFIWFSELLADGRMYCLYGWRQTKTHAL